MISSWLIEQAIGAAMLFVVSSALLFLAVLIDDMRKKKP